jgi:hypothetical protein
VLSVSSANADDFHDGLAAWARQDDATAVRLWMLNQGSDKAGNIVGAGILVPDGRVICPREATFPSEAEWAEAILRQASERAQPRP